mgnify:CR=1 FL=1
MIEQLTETFANPNEMGTTPEEIAKNVESKPYYQTLFKLAGVNPNSDNVKIALRAFINTFNRFSLFPTSYYFKEMAIPYLTLFVNKYKTRALFT